MLHQQYEYYRHSLHRVSILSLPLLSCLVVSMLEDLRHRISDKVKSFQNIISIKSKMFFSSRPSQVSPNLVPYFITLREQVHQQQRLSQQSSNIQDLPPKYEDIGHFNNAFQHPDQNNSHQHLPAQPPAYSEVIASDQNRR